MFFFTADEHYGHHNILKYCQRPFVDAQEMNREIIIKHNEVVQSGDTVVHIGDFTLGSLESALGYIRQLKGHHIFLPGSHDKWMGTNTRETEAAQAAIQGLGHVLFPSHLWTRVFNGGICLNVCHYALRTWPKSHYNSWHLYGHSHGNLPGVGKSFDAGVDGNNFYPWSLKVITEVMEGLPDNPGFLAIQARRNQDAKTE